MKRLCILSLGIACLASPAMAISRYNAMAYSCDQARQLINRERAVILRYPAARTKNMTLYDRFVEDARSCDSGYYATESYIPTKDNPSCRLYVCAPNTDFDDSNFIIPRR